MRLSSCLDLCQRRRREKERESERGEREGERSGKIEREKRESERERGGKGTKEFKCGEGGTLCIIRLEPHNVSYIIALDLGLTLCLYHIIQI